MVPRLGSLLILFALCVPAAQPIRFSSPGHTDILDWFAEATISSDTWQPGDVVSVVTSLVVTNAHVDAVKAMKIPVDGFCLLVTAERTFDADGWIRLSSDEKMSTLLTPTRLAIEGGVQGAVTNRFGYGFRTPVDIFMTRPISAAERNDQGMRITFSADQALPASLPPGVYRVRLDYGFTAAGRYYSLNAETFAYRPFFKTVPTHSHMYSQPIRASGVHASGRTVDAAKIQPRLPWTLLASYNSNGYYGVVADEDQGRFALSNRIIIPDDVILPLYDSAGKQLSYSLEPQFPTDTIELRSNIPWNFASGEISIQILNPDGKITDLGVSPFVDAKGQWPTTKRAAVTAWKPPAYGRYTVKATGWINDIWGNRYEGGGVYHFWIANRMTMATATFQGMAYPVGGRYGRDMAFAPAVPADVTVNATLYVNSDPADTRSVSYTGKASPAGIFGAAQGMQPLTLSAPGEYHAHVLATYTDSKGNLWVSSMRHAGVVYDPESPIVARGKKLTVGSKYVERGETKLEGYIDPDGTTHLQHINYPWNPGDVLLIASDGQGANKIEPVLTWDFKDYPLNYDSKLQSIGITNVALQTSNRLSPHMFPEYITDWQYYYGAAPRPGFMSRFLVADNGTRAPYWPTSPNSFGGQINASSNGDLPGDIYRLIGGVALRFQGRKPLYAGYIASAFILPRGSNNNRVIAAGSEDVPGPYNALARAFLVGTRPGMMYETGTTFGPAVQIDPILPVDLNFTLDYPDGRRVMTSGVGDATGSWAGEKWTLDVPGIYRFNLTGNWMDHRASMPGLPADGGLLYVVEKDRPANAPEIQFNLPVQSSFNAVTGATITGKSTAKTVSYAAIMPGAVLDQGTLTVQNGQFQLAWDPKAMNQRTPTYDTANRVTGTADIKDVVHLTFFSEETAPDGKKYHSFARLILRGTQIFWAK